MPSVYDLKPRFQALLRPLTSRLATAGVTANQVTLSAVALSAAVGAAILLSGAAAWSLLLVPLALFVRMALNAIDGMLAREHAQKSPFGAMLNEVGDVVSDAFLYLPLVVVPGLSPLALAAAVGMGMVTEVAGLSAVLAGANRRYEGPMGKSDRALWLGTLAFALGLGLPTGWWTTLGLAAIALLALQTTTNRMTAAMTALATTAGGRL